MLKARINNTGKHLSRHWFWLAVKLVVALPFFALAVFFSRHWEEASNVAVFFMLVGALILFSPSGIPQKPQRGDEE